MRRTIASSGETTPKGGNTQEPIKEKGIIDIKIHKLFELCHYEFGEQGQLCQRVLIFIIHKFFF